MSLIDSAHRGRHLPSMFRVHGTCIDIDGYGVLLRGPSGSGKSDLALRLIDGGARLVADDQTELSARDGRIVASPPPVLAGLLEVRGLGILRLGHSPSAPLTLVVDLVSPQAVERLPEPSFCDFSGIRLPRLALAPFEQSAAAKVRLAVRAATRDIMSVT